LSGFMGNAFLVFRQLLWYCNFRGSGLHKRSGQMQRSKLVP
jgi:hypothetical protein